MKIIRGQIYLTTGEAALQLGVTARTILRWSASNQSKQTREEPRLNPVKGPNNRLYFRQDEIDQMLDFYFGATPATPSIELTAPAVRPRARRNSTRANSAQLAVAR